MLFSKGRSATPSTLFGRVALVLLAVGVPPAGFSQTASFKAKVAVRAVTRDDIAAYKLPSTTQTSAGLSTVGLGQPAHLEILIDKSVNPAEIVSASLVITRKPDGSNATIAESPFAAEVPTYEPADRAGYQIAGRYLLRPDTAGFYMLTAEVRTKTLGTISMPFTITGATYVGSSKCTTCHSGGSSQPWSMGNTWARTSHATLFRDGVDGVASDHYSASCISCHTVGYDTVALADNGGFDDVAARLKWVFPTVQKAGTFDTSPVHPTVALK